MDSTSYQNKLLEKNIEEMSKYLIGLMDDPIQMPTEYTVPDLTCACGYSSKNLHFEIFAMVSKVEVCTRYNQKDRYKLYVSEMNEAKTLHLQMTSNDAWIYLLTLFNNLSFQTDGIFLYDATYTNEILASYNMSVSNLTKRAISKSLQLLQKLRIIVNRNVTSENKDIQLECKKSLELFQNAIWNLEKYKNINFHLNDVETFWKIYEDLKNLIERTRNSMSNVFLFQMAVKNNIEGKIENNWEPKQTEFKTEKGLFNYQSSRNIG